MKLQCLHSILHVDDLVEEEFLLLVLLLVLRGFVGLVAVLTLSAAMGVVAGLAVVAFAAGFTSLSYLVL